MKRITKSLAHLLSILFLSSILFSCKTKELLPLPNVTAIVNTFEYTVQPMDEDAKCDNSTLTAFYDGFNVIYSLNKNRIMKFCIENKTNKYLILDKSKCYVIYDGYSRELFKDVRSGRSTTYNNVQDAINSVSTNESSITLSIPPYSKWELPIEETNLEAIKEYTSIKTELGSHSLNPYTTNQTIEFVIPYSWDYSLSKWDTSRNRLYIGNINVEEKLCAYPGAATRYNIFREKNYSKAGITKAGRAEYDRVVELNKEIERKNAKIKRNNYIAKVTSICVAVPVGLLCIMAIVSAALG